MGTEFPTERRIKGVFIEILFWLLPGFIDKPERGKIKKGPKGVI